MAIGDGTDATDAGMAIVLGTALGLPAAPAPSAHAH